MSDKKRCELCGTPVTIYSGKEGTNSYVSAYDALAEKLKQVETRASLAEIESDQLRERVRELEAENEKHRWRLVGAQVDPTVEALRAQVSEYERALETAASLGSHPVDIREDARYALAKHAGKGE